MLVAALLTLAALPQAAADAQPQASDVPQASDAPWIELFPGGSLEGWTVVGGDGQYEIEQGDDGVPVIYGHSATAKNTFLMSEREYADFVLEIEVKIEAGGNSGIQFRSHVNDKGRLFGYQAEVDPSERSWSAGIYDEGRRGWIADLSKNAAAREAFQVGEWNRYVIAAQGGLLKTWVNGVPAADHYDEADASGHLALQVHSGGRTQVRWRNARIRVLPPLWKQAARISGEFFGDHAMVQNRGIPGRMAVYGQRAMPLLLDDEMLPVAAVAWYGAGAVVAVAHNAYAAEGTTFRRRALGWLMKTSAGPEGRRGADAADGAATAGDGRTSDQLVARRWQGDGPSAEELAATDVLLMDGNGPLAPERARAVREWVARGGALYTALCPWGFEQIHARRGWTARTDLAENQVLAPMGLVYTDGTCKADEHFGVTPDALPMAHATVVLASLPLASGTPLPDMAPVEHALRSLPPGAAPAFEELFDAVVGPVTEENAPRPDRALKKSDPYARLAIVAASLAWRDLPPEEVRPAPGAAAFPGAVDPKNETVIRSDWYQSSGRGAWLNAGVYLAPGEILHAKVLDGTPEGWRLRIGAHRDKVWHKDAWQRWPEITAEWPLEQDMRVATPWGGMVYLVAAGETDAVHVEFQGGVESPAWFPGWDGGPWRERIAEWPAPWVDYEGEKLILSVPLEAARTVDDPTELMAFWDEVMTAHYKLAGVEPPARKERFVPDAQISAGYMHSGYPIMMHLDVVEVPEGGGPPVLLDVETLRAKGNWGMFHELGHNLQDRAWTFGGTVEVTCNWFSLHAGDVVCGIEPWRNPWLETQKAKGLAYLEAGADFSEWKRKPGVALLCYAQLQRAFGWEPYYEALAWYQALAPAERPQNDAEKQDLWVRRMSLATGHDLRPFHAEWGWPLGEALRKDAELAELPEWMPDFDELRDEPLPRSRRPGR